jgi:hypothetical protein
MFSCCVRPAVVEEQVALDDSARLLLKSTSVKGKEGAQNGKNAAIFV